MVGCASRAKCSSGNLNKGTQTLQILNSPADGDTDLILDFTKFFYGLASCVHYPFWVDSENLYVYFHIWKHKMQHVLHINW